MSWTYSLDTIIEYIDTYLKVINYFIKKYPSKILRINLEELTRNSDKLSKNLHFL